MAVEKNCGFYPATLDLERNHAYDVCTGLWSASRINKETQVDTNTVIAVYSRMVRTHGCSVDSILESPELRDEYLGAMRQLVGNLPEQKLLHELTTLRKRSKLPRSRDLFKFTTT